MAQITLYIDDETEALVKRSAAAEGKSRSRWVVELIQERVRTDWPTEVKQFLGRWSDFPTAEEIRDSQAADLPREPL